MAAYEDVNVAIQAFETERPKAEADETRLPVLRERDKQVTIVAAKETAGPWTQTQTLPESFERIPQAPPFEAIHAATGKTFAEIEQEYAAQSTVDA